MATLPQDKLDDGPGALLEGMAEMRTTIDKQKYRIKFLQEEVKKLKEKETEMETTITLLSQENVGLKQGSKAQDARMREQRDENWHKIRKLDMESKAGKTKVGNLEKKLATTEQMYKDTIAKREDEIATLKEKLHAAETQAKQAQNERNKVKEELNDVQNRTRKLLNTLDLSNDIKNSSMSIEHARNISYVRRRRSTAIAPQINTLTSNDQPLLYKREESGTGLLPIRDSFPPPGIPPPVVDSGSTTASSSSLSNSIATKKPKTDFAAITEDDIRLEDVSTESVADSRDPGVSKETVPKLKCVTCGKFYEEVTNFEGACLHHKEGAVLLNEGTELEVWSCCKSAQTFKGCVKSHHVQV